MLFGHISPPPGGGQTEKYTPLIIFLLKTLYGAVRMKERINRRTIGSRYKKLAYLGGGGGHTQPFIHFFRIF